MAWFSRTHACVTLLTTEAEYFAMGGGAKEALFMRGVVTFSYLNRNLGENAAVDHNKGATAFGRNLFWGAPNRRGTSYSRPREGDVS